MFWGVLTFGFSTVILSIYLYLMNKEIKNISNQLKNYNHKNTNKKIDINLFNKNIEFLAKNINNHIDISKELQIKQIQSEKEFKKSIANISHDLRTPLTSIRGYLQILNKDGIDDAKKKKYIDIIDRRARDLQALLNDFFMMSVIDSKEYDINLESIDVSELLIESISDFYDEFNKKGINPKIDIDEGENIVLGDYRSLKRIIDNLIINAIKHSEGEVIINLKNKDGEIILSLCNVAHGLLGCEESLLFNRFYKKDGARTINSTGLGLYIVKELMEKMGGKVNIKLEDNFFNIYCKWKGV